MSHRVCEPAVHAQLKASRKAWDAGTVPIGVMPGLKGEADLEMANCRACHTTLAISATKKGAA